MQVHPTHDPDVIDRRARFALLMREFDNAEIRSNDVEHLAGACLRGEDIGPEQAVRVLGLASRLAKQNRELRKGMARLKERVRVHEAKPRPKIVYRSTLADRLRYLLKNAPRRLAVAEIETLIRFADSKTALPVVHESGDEGCTFVVKEDGSFPISLDEAPE